MDGTNFALAMSSLCLVLHSASARDVFSQAIDGEAFTPLIDYAWNLVDIPLSDMTLLVIKSIRTSVMDSPMTVSSPDIHTQKI
jgi:hypothetical protein